MKDDLHVLIIEDLPSDAELAERELVTTLKNPTVQVVDNQKSLLQALEAFQPELIISDYQMPAFDGLSALHISREKAPFTPFIILTGSMNEERAVECIKAGADDYVSKEQIQRLGQAAAGAKSSASSTGPRANKEGAGKTTARPPGRQLGSTDSANAKAESNFPRAASASPANNIASKLSGSSSSDL